MLSNSSSLSFETSFFFNRPLAINQNIIQTISFPLLFLSSPLPFCPGGEEPLGAPGRPLGPEGRPGDGGSGGRARQAALEQGETTGKRFVFVGEAGLGGVKLS